MKNTMFPGGPMTIPDLDRICNAMRDCKCPSDAAFLVRDCIGNGVCGCTPGAILISVERERNNQDNRQVQLNDNPAYPSPWWTQLEVAARWNISPRTLERWRWVGEGPKYCKIGGLVRYNFADIVAWEASQLCNSTADVPEHKQRRI